MRRKSRSQMLNVRKTNIRYGHGIGDVLSNIGNTIARNAPIIARNVSSAAQKIGKTTYNYLDKHPEVLNPLVRAGSEVASAYMRRKAKQMTSPPKHAITEEEFEDTEEDKKRIDDLLNAMKNEHISTPKSSFSKKPATKPATKKENTTHPFGSGFSHL